MKRRISVAMVGLRGIPATYGGVERAVHELSVRLARRGHDVTVYCRRGYVDPQLREYQGVRLRSLPQVNTKHLEAASHTALALSHALASRRFDLIHIHATGPALFSPLARMCRMPTVVTVQGLDWKREKWGPIASGALRIGAWIAATVPHRTIVVSKELRRVFAESFARGSSYIPNGVDAEGLQSVSGPVEDLEAGRFILFMARLVPEKGAHTLIDAYREVDTEIPLAIVGPSSHSDGYLRDLRERARGDRRIRFLGARYQGEKNWLLQHAKVFVQPSTIEGLPITLLEALACDRFAVVSDIPENLEVVTFGRRRFGEVFRTGDKDDLARVLARVLRRGDLQTEGSAAGAAARAEYDWERITDETVRVYQDVLSD